MRGSPRGKVVGEEREVVGEVRLLERWGSWRGEVVGEER